jgi:hypothetical protein
MLHALRSLIRLRVEGSRFVRGVKEKHVLPADGRFTIVGPCPVRVLLFGGDYATGTNVGSRRDALDGAVAELLHEHTGRGVIVENRSYPESRLDQLIPSLGATGALTFDLVIWCPTFSEAVRRPFPRAWRSALTDVVRFLRSTSDAGIVLLGIPDLLGSQPIAQLARSRAGTLNRAIAGAAEGHADVLAVNPPAVHHDTIVALDARTAYRQVAAALVPALVQLLASRSGAAAAVVR